MSVHNIRTERMQPGDVYIGRRHPRMNPEATDITPGCDGYFGNPFVIRGEEIDRDKAVADFEAYARDRIQTDPEFRKRVKGLHGTRLFCWCAPEKCHGDVLEKLAHELVEADRAVSEGGA